jgi:hypothetical protein
LAHKGRLKDVWQDDIANIVVAVKDVFDKARQAKRCHDSPPGESVHAFSAGLDKGLFEGGIPADILQE